MMRSAILLVFITITSVAECQLKFGMSKKQVFDSIGSEKINQHLPSGFGRDKDTTYYAYSVEIAQDLIVKVSDDRLTYAEIGEKGGWVGDYDGIRFKDDTLVSYRWKTHLTDSTIAYKARFEIFFSFSARMSMASIPYIPQSSPYYYPAPKGTLDIPSKHPWCLWSNDKVTYELHFYTESILLEMYQGPPKDRD